MSDETQRTSKPTLEDLTVTSEGGNDLDFQIHEGDFLVGITPANGGDSRWVSLNKSRAAAIRDWLNKAIPAHEPSSVAVNEPVFYRCETCKEIMLAAHLVGTDSHERIEETSEGQPYQVTCGPVRPSVLSAGEYINRFLPANWMNDSSLETWFPITAEELKRLKDERAAQPPSDVQRDAERWRALIGCARVRVMGSAGIHDPKSNYAHIGVEFWTHHKAQSNPRDIETILKFVERAARTKDAPRLCPHGMPLEENICGPCSQGRPNRRADVIDITCDEDDERVIESVFVLDDICVKGQSETKDAPPPPPQPPPKRVIGEYAPGFRPRDADETSAAPGDDLPQKLRAMRDVPADKLHRSFDAAAKNRGGK